MSHVVTIRTEIRDLAAIQAACRRLNLERPKQGTFTLYSGEATGVAVQLPDWAYPCVFDLAKGQVQYDNFQGHWGDQKHLRAFRQAYAVERCRIEARQKGHSVTEQALPDGSIRLTIQVNGGAAR